MVGCSVLGCKSRSERKITGITFHSFPSNSYTRSKWVDATGKPNWQPTIYSKMCSVHFGDELFVYKKFLVLLKPNSVPEKHIHIRIPSHQGTKDLHKMQQENILSTHPSTSQQNIYATSSTKRSSDVLKEVHNIQPKKLCLVPTGDLGNLAESKLPVPQPALPSTPKKEGQLKKLLYREKKKATNRLKKLRAVRESKRRLSKKICRLENIIAELKCKMQINPEELDLLSNIETENADFLRRYLDKKNCPRKYSASLRKFALCLHFISPKAYAFVRNQFDTSLPHPKTLYRWYTCIDCQPGFTKEALEAIKLLVSKKPGIVLCSVCLDEMSIRQQLQWNGKQTVGYVNVGDNLDTDNLPIAKDALVFMVTAINDNWKMPVGYFLTNGVNGEQRSALLQTCINLLSECGLKIISITFDGCPANFAMAKILGAQFDDANRIKPIIKVAGQNIVICPDACHMLKLVRNTLADKKEMVNADKEIISWKYIEKLHVLQQNEGLHLSNKIRIAHVNFKKQIMKVRLAAQTFSRSVAVALAFCRDDLNIDDFADSGATIEFIKYFNDIFDILNSRRLSAYDFKKPISQENFLIIDAKLKAFETYVRNLKFTQGQTVVSSGRKTGFLGFLICVTAVREIFNEYINVENAPLRYLCTYKMSQDHLELFFSAIRSKGGFNNNPTALQFMSAYRRLLIHSELKNISSGNCIPLQSINILTCNMKAICRKINSRRSRLLTMNESLGFEDEGIDLPQDHDYIEHCEMTAFSKEATIYIAGYIIMNMKKIIKCGDCIGAIISNEKYPGFILRRDVGGLHYPSDDVVKVCLFSEKTLKHIIAVHSNAYFAKKDSLPKMVCSTLKRFINTQIFAELNDHVNEQNPLENHTALLIKAIAFRYFEIRIHFIMKRSSLGQDRIRSFHTKLVLFKGQ